LVNKSWALPMKSGAAATRATTPGEAAMTKGQTAMTEVDRLLAAARATMAETIDCWVMTPSASDGVHARVVEPIAAAPDDEDWTVSFIASARSRKATMV
jgi:hypothetical protein